jgi:hypothetical protein
MFELGVSVTLASERRADLRQASDRWRHDTISRRIGMRFDPDQQPAGLSVAR